MNCFSCGEYVHSKRWQLGYRVCLDCGEVMARAVKHTQLPLNKSNYIYVSPNDTETPKQLNPKRSEL
jgi:ribosomal protein L37AE/L43A